MKIKKIIKELEKRRIVIPDNFFDDLENSINVESLRLDDIIALIYNYNN